MNDFLENLGYLLGFGKYPPSIADRVWEVKNVRNTYRVRALFGYTLEYRISIHIARKNDEEYIQSRMYDATSVERFVQQFYAEYVRPLVEAGDLKFLLHWYVVNIESREIATHRCAVVDATSGLEDVDSKIVSNADITKRLTDVRYAKNGCVIEQCFFKLLWPNDCIIRENAALIPRELRQQLEADMSVLEYNAAKVAFAMESHLEAMRTIQKAEYKQTHTSAHLSITVDVVECAVKISWTVNGVSSQRRIIGFRNTSGFVLAVERDEENGTLIVDSRGEGTVVDHADAGKTVFYTFLVKAPNSENAVTTVDSIRFSVRTPTLVESAAIRNLAEATQSALNRQQNTSKTESRRKILEDMQHFKEMANLFDAEEHKGIEEIKRKKLSAAEEAEKIQAWREYIAMFREKHMP